MSGRVTNEAGHKHLTDAAFTIESVAHIQGWEKDLLPIAEQLRKVIETYKKELSS